MRGNTVEDLGRLEVLAEVGVDQGVDVGGEQRSPDPFARDVGNDHRDLVGVRSFDDLVVVARDPARRNIPTVDFEARHLWVLGRQQCDLDAARKGDLLLEALPLGGFLRECEVAEAQTGGGSDHRQQLHVARTEETGGEGGAEDDHSDGALRCQQRRRHKGPYAGVEQALGGRETVVGRGVVDNGGQSFADDFAGETLRLGKLVRSRDLRPARCDHDVVFVLEEYRAVLWAQVDEDRSRT